MTTLIVPQNLRQYVDRAISSSVSLLTIKEFITATNFAIDEESFNRLFTALDDNYPIYVDEAMLNWMGYEGEYKRQLLSLKNLLARNLSDMEYKILKNDKYAIYLEELGTQVGTALQSQQNTLFRIVISNINKFPFPSTGLSNGKTHLILEPDTFRSLCMMINTERGKQIRQYYLTLERLVKAYTFYQSIFRIQEAERSLAEKDSKIGELITTIQTNELKAQEERTNAEERFNKLMTRTEVITDKLDETSEMLEDTRTEVISASATINRMAGNCVVPTSVKPSSLEVFAIFQNMRTNRLRATCVQRVSYTRTYKDYLSDIAPDVGREVLKIDYNANAGIFWIAFYKKYGATFMRNESGKQFDLAPNKTLAELCAIVRQAIDEQKIESTI